MKVVNDYMSRLISRIGNDLGLIKEGFKSCWVTDFPMFEENSEGRLTALHHPFTSPKEQDPSKLKDSDSLEINSKAYDMVLNGVEIGGGSIRIHDSELQQKFSIFLVYLKKSKMKNLDSF